MMKWEFAAQQFLEQWIHQEEVIGVLICGSYITGNPSARSDIDIHIILSENTTWRERGNQVVDGILIEYFANPPQQIRGYFKEDYGDRSTMSMTQFITGKVMLDKIGVIAQLKEEALEWKDKRYEPLPAALNELNKYKLWDRLDNLLDCFEQSRNDFYFVYYISLVELFNDYCQLLNVEIIPYYQIHSYLTDSAYLSKYIKEQFLDERFANIFVEALQCIDKQRMISLYKELVVHIFNKTDGFNIDGWKIRSPLDV